MDSLRGQLLVAAPSLLDPNFHRTVALIADHGEDGALGVILNRPAELTVGEGVPELSGALDEDEPLWLGGPVRAEGVIVLAEWEEQDDRRPRILGDIGLLAPDTGIDDLAEHARRARAYAGYAGWGPGQLEVELERDDWVVLDATVEDVFCTEPEDLWVRVLTREGGSYALLARMPDDPSMN